MPLECHIDQMVENEINFLATYWPINIGLQQSCQSTINTSTTPYETSGEGDTDTFSAMPSIPSGERIMPRPWHMDCRTSGINATGDRSLIA